MIELQTELLSKLACYGELQQPASGRDNREQEPATSPILSKLDAPSGPELGKKK